MEYFEVLAEGMSFEFRELGEARAQHFGKSSGPSPLHNPHLAAGFQAVSVRHFLPLAGKGLEQDSVITGECRDHAKAAVGST